VASYRFKDEVFDEFKIRKIQLIERKTDEWVAFFWSKTGQEAIARGETAMEALQAAIDYLTQSFRLPPSMLVGAADSEMPMTESSIKRNKNNRILSSGETIMHRFYQKKELQGDMEVLLPKKDLDEAEKKSDIILPVGYPDVQGEYEKVQVPQSDLKGLKDQFDALPSQSYTPEKKYLLWIKTMAGKMKESCPFDLHRGAVVATGLATGKYNTFFYFKVGKIDRELTVSGEEPVIVNFSRHENFQVQLYGMDESVSIPDHVKESVAKWSRIDLDEDEDEE